MGLLRASLIVPALLLTPAAHAAGLQGAAPSGWDRSATSPEVLPQLGPARSLSFHAAESSSTLNNDPSATPDWVYASDRPEAVSLSRPDGSTIRIGASAAKQATKSDDADEGAGSDLAVFSGPGNQVLPSASAGSQASVARITAGSSSAGEAPRFHALPRAAGGAAPEPSSLLLFGCALFGAAGWKKRKNAAESASEEPAA